MANLSNINNKFLVTTGGNVGIGNTSPTLSTLTVGIGSTNNPSQICQLAGSGSGVYSVLSLTNTNGVAADNNGVGLDFHVNAAYSATGRIQLIHPTAQSGTTTNASMQFLTYGTIGGVTTFSPRMTIDYIGNVGIGTVSPGFATIDGYTQRGIEIKGAKESGTGPVIRLYETGSGKGAFEIRSNRNALTSGNYLAFGESADTFMVIRGDDDGGGVTTRGNVGIGTVSPSGKLHVSTGTDTSVGNIEFFIGGTNASNARSGKIIKNTTSPYEMTIRASNFSNGNNLILNDTGGTVGIGTTSPSIATSLHIRNATSSSYATLRLEGSNRGGIIEMYQGAYPVSKIQTDQSGNTYFSTSGVFGSTTLTAKMTILTAGNVGIGTTSPDQQLDVAKSAIIGSESVGSSTTNSENMLIVKGKNNYSDGTTWYGDYGQILLDVSSNMTGSAKKFLITNALDNNKFAIVRSDFNAIPTVNSTGNGVNIGTADFVIDNSGKVGIGTALPTSQLYVNNTSDGDKIRWGRSDALVGSVGTYNGVPYIGYQGGAGGGIMFNGLSIEPTALGSTRSDDTNDLGSVNNRWKNIYLGGGAFLGGTGAANKLDYYEEGTWTPVIAHNNGTGVVPATVSAARYIRVGQLVYVSCYLTSINPTGTAGGSGPYYGIIGMPYTPENYGAWQIVYASGPITAYGGYSSSASLYFMSNGTNGQRSQGHVNGAGVNAWGSNLTLMMNCTYNING